MNPCMETVESFYLCPKRLGIYYRQQQSQSQQSEVEHRSISLFAAGESEGPYIQPFRIGNNKINKEAVKDLILAT